MYIIAGAFSKFKELSLFILKNKITDITVYDGVSNCSWNGGRINRDVTFNQAQIDFYYKRNIGIALTFTNHEIDLSDETGNYLLETFHKKGNKIILVNDELRCYIRKSYPLYDLTYSITGTGHLNIPMQQSDYNFYKDLEFKYDLIVPRMEHIFDPLFLKLDQSKYEIMLNDNCAWGCPKYKEHFEAINNQNKTLSPWTTLGSDHCTKIEECWLPKFNPDIDSKHKEMDINLETQKELFSRGIKHFKISGRELSDINFRYELEQINYFEQ